MSVSDEESSYFNAIIADAGLAGKIWIECHYDQWQEYDGYTVDRHDSYDTKIFPNADEAFAYVVEQYPDVDWERI